MGGTFIYTFRNFRLIFNRPLLALVHNIINLQYISISSKGVPCLDLMEDSFQRKQRVSRI
jgi:hypothetical protein